MNNSALATAGASVFVTKAAIVGGTATTIATTTGGVGIASAGGVTAVAVAAPVAIFALPFIALGCGIYFASRE